MQTNALRCSLLVPNGTLPFFRLVGLGGHVLLISFCGQRNRVAGGCVRTATAIKSEESQNETFIHVQG